MTRLLIDAHKVCKSYSGQAVLRGVDLQVAAGEMVALMGRSGSGKSTLLNILGGLDRDYQGAVRVLDQDLATLSDAALSRLRNDSIGFVFQAFHLLDHLSCRENVVLPGAFARARAETEASHEWADEVLRRVGLPGLGGVRPAELSGGQKQRVAIARALFRRPQLLLCDEPTGNLDGVTGGQIIDLFHALHDEGLTLILVTHEDRVSRAAGRVVTLEDGRVVAQEGAAA